MNDVIDKNIQLENNNKQLFNICLRTSSLKNPGSIKTYQSIGGYEQIKRILKNNIDPQQLVDEIKISGLRAGVELVSRQELNGHSCPEITMVPNILFVIVTRESQVHLRIGTSFATTPIN